MHNYRNPTLLKSKLPKTSCSFNLPLELATETILVKKLLVVRPELVDGDPQIIITILCIEVKFVKETNPFKTIFILWLEQVLVGTLIMDRVCTVITNHVQALEWNGSVVGDKHSPHVLIVAPRKHELVQSTVRLVATILGVVPSVVHVRIELVKFWQDDSIVLQKRAMENIRTQTTLTFRLSKEELTGILHPTTKVSPPSAHCLPVGEYPS